MTKGILRATVLLLPLLALPWTATAATQSGSEGGGLVARDASGRVLSRTELLSDGKRRVTHNEYWPQSQTLRRSLAEDSDPSGRVVGKTTQEFDERGRPLDRRTVTIDTAGREHGTRTHYTYDPQGHSRETTAPVGR